MPSNPPDIWSIFSALGTFASGLGTVLLVWLAVRGLNQWRAQLQGTSKYKLAQRLGLLALQFKDQFSQARYARTFSNESFDRPTYPDEPEGFVQINNEHYARRQRLKPLSETIRKLIEAGWEAEII